MKGKGKKQKRKIKNAKSKKTKIKKFNLTAIIMLLLTPFVGLNFVTLSVINYFIKLLFRISIYK